MLFLLKYIATKSLDPPLNQTCPLEQGYATIKNHELLLAAHEPPFSIYFVARSAREKETKLQESKREKK